MCRLLSHRLADVLQVLVSGEGPVAVSCHRTLKMLQVADVGVGIGRIEESLYLIVGTLLRAVLIESLPLARLGQKNL